MDPATESTSVDDESWLIPISDEDRARGGFSDMHLAGAVARFKSLGFVVVRGALATEYVGNVRREYMEALETKVARLQIRAVESADPTHEQNENVHWDFRPMGGNHDLNRWNMHLPSRWPFLDDRLLANPFALGIIRSLMGPDCVLATIGSDTPFPRAGFQTIHQDDYGLRVTMNVALVDFRADNAPIEVWPGTHQADPLAPNRRFTEARVELSEDRIRSLKDVVRRRRVLLRAGDLLIRDQRMLHRGTANLSSEPRPMLSLLYHPPPTRVPHPVVTDTAAAIALRVRETARKLPDGEAAIRALDQANRAGRIIEHNSGSDRDYRRVIPAPQWSALSPAAKRLLRFARVEDPKWRSDGRRSFRSSCVLVWHCFQMGLSVLRAKQA
jgi:ectoine hydroxylase-related dioxygenase (phytanoyl-CoA dioxygenase family)